MAPITLYFLQSSRAIRIAWLLEELNLDYDVESFDRARGGDTPEDYRKKPGMEVGRAPGIRDGDMTLIESGAICEYLCEAYDGEHRLMPADLATRAQVRTWMSAAEGTFLVHALAILYGSGAAPESADALQKALSGQVHRDFDWLEETLKGGGGKYIVGNRVTAADVMMGFSCAFILKVGLGTKGSSWPAVEAWLKHIEGTDTYKAAVKKTGHTLG